MVEDFTGKSRFSRNVLVYWGAQILVLAVGFIVPRQISDHLGVEALGMWDLGWATYRYMSMTGIGAFGVNRYMALYRASDNAEAQSRLYTTAIYIQAMVSIGLLAVTLVLTLLADRLDVAGFESGDVRLIIFLFCISVIVRLLGDPSLGVMTGVHRWDLHHTINASQDVGLAAALIISLAFHAGLITLAFLVLFSSLLTTLVRILVKNQLCPEVKFVPNLGDRKLGVELVRFGAKSLSNTGAQLILFQTIAVTIGLAAGPAALAIFSRSQTLVRMSDSIIQKVANILMPITSSLIGLRLGDEAEALLVDACTLFMCAALPICLMLIFFGDLIVMVWMGDQYVNRTLVCVLAFGALLPISNYGTYSVLAGLNAHGKPGLTSLAIVIIGLAILVPWVRHYWGVSHLSAAIIVSTLWTLSRGVVIPIFLKIRFGIAVSTYLVRGILRPLMYFLPMAGLLALSREALLVQSYTLSVLMVLAAGVITLPLIWFGLLPDSIKEMLIMRSTDAA